MLVTCFVIIVEGADAGLLFILDDLFAEDFELKLHKVDLLLQIDNVSVGGVHVWVLPKLSHGRLFLLLASEVHSYGRLVACRIAK